jgi:hypothetical protein
MKKNLGSIDRSARALAAVVIGILYFTYLTPGITATILGAFAVVLLSTSVIGVCPLYMPLKLSTMIKKSSSAG